MTSAIPWGNANCWTFCSDGREQKSQAFNGVPITVPAQASNMCQDQMATELAQEGGAVSMSVGSIQEGMQRRRLLELCILAASQ